MRRPQPRPRLATSERTSGPRRSVVPGHAALVGAAIALAVALAGVTVAEAASGGVGASGAAGGTGGAADQGDPACPNGQLGRRTLRRGDCGGDVATLNWILNAKQAGAPPLAGRFGAPTETAVERFQATADLAPSGVVDSGTSAALVRSMPAQLATWYGPGFFGRRTACGQRLTPRTRGVAHRKLPCGTRVVVRYRGRFVRTRVIDRGPFANGAKWDLAQATARQLHFEYTDDVRVAKLAARRGD